jgi:hypothetical protein
MAIGQELYTVSRPNKYFYTGVSGTNKTPLCQPPTNGCYLRVEGVGTVGTIKAYGTVGGAVTTETISTFDSDKVGMGTKLFTAFTKFDVTSFTSVIVYPATKTGEKINLASSTTFTILCDTYDVNETQFRGEYIDVAGHAYKIYKTMMYDGRYTLQNEDKITIDGQEYTIANVSNKKHGIYSAFLIIWR